MHITWGGPPLPPLLTPQGLDFASPILSGLPVLWYSGAEPSVPLPCVRSWQPLRFFSDLPKLNHWSRFKKPRVGLSVLGGGTGHNGSICCQLCSPPRHQTPSSLPFSSQMTHFPPISNISLTPCHHGTYPCQWMPLPV